MSLKIYSSPLVVTDSGGKDSLVNLHLTEQAGIPFEVQHNHTTADAPETIHYIKKRKEEYKDKGIKYTINWPTYQGKRVSMWTLIPQKKSPPTRLQRYCCEILKEQGGMGRFITTGVRWSESQKRKANRGIYETISSKKRIILNNDNDNKRMLFERCSLKSRHVCNPIIDFKDTDIWDIIRTDRLEYNPQYDNGYSRVGCIGCPMAGKHRWREFRDYPAYKIIYIHAFERMLKEIHASGKPTKWKSGEDVFLWWMEDTNIKGQYSMEFDGTDLARYTEKPLM